MRTNSIATVTAAMLFGMLAAPANAQPACGEFAMPFQGRDSSGLAQLNTKTLVPPNQFGFYPVQFAFPDNAAAIGLVGWTHRVPAAVPAGAIQFFVYIDRNRPHPGFDHNAIVAGMFANDGTGLPEQQNLSHPLNRNEAVTVGAYSTYPLPVLIDLIVTMHACFGSQAELDDFMVTSEMPATQMNATP